MAEPRPLACDILACTEVTCTLSLAGADSSFCAPPAAALTKLLGCFTMSGRLPSAELLEEICVRFILTLPATELE